MTDATISQVAQQITETLAVWNQNQSRHSDWLGGTASGGPNGDGRYPLLNARGVETLVMSPARMADYVSGPAAIAELAKAVAELARDQAIAAADKSEAQRVLAEAARGAAVDARNLAQTHRSFAGTSEANARYWAELAQGQGAQTSEDRDVVQQLHDETVSARGQAVSSAQAAATSAAQAATFDPALFDKKSDTLTASRLTGTLDPARLPSTVFQAPIPAASTIASLTTAQQTEIRIGSTIVTSDGVFWSYVGGAKTAEASYRSMADTTPPWSAIADKPSYFPTNIANVSGLQSALDAKAPNSYPVFTGDGTLGGRFTAGWLTANSLTFNTGLLYHDGNHSVMKTGQAGSEKYWRFDANGTLYALNGGLYTNANVQAMGLMVVGPSDGAANGTTIGPGYLEVRSQAYGAYIDLSDRNSAEQDFGGRLQYANANLTISNGSGGNLVIGGGCVYANSSDGVQSGKVITENGNADQVITTRKVFKGSGTTNADFNSASIYPALEVQGNGGAAMMSFHRPGAWATFFGLGTDNQFRYGGWSAGQTSYRFWTEQNFDPLSRMERYTDGWIQSREGANRFYFGSNGRTYFGSRDGYEWRDANDAKIADLNGGGTLEVKGDLSTLGNNLKIRGGSPTIYFKDTDHRSAMIHVNSGWLYILRGAGSDAEGWDTVDGRWPFQINLENNAALFGSSIDARTEVFHRGGHQMPKITKSQSAPDFGAQEGDVHIVW